MDPRTRDAIRQIPEELEELRNRLDAVEELSIGIYKLVRSTNESVVRKYGKGKNTAAKVAKEVEKIIPKKKKDK